MLLCVVGAQDLMQTVKSVRESTLLAMILRAACSTEVRSLLVERERFVATS